MSEHAHTPLGEAEASFLGACILQDGRGASSYRNLLYIDAYSEPQHGFLAEMIGDMLDKSKVIDLVTLCHALSERKDTQGQDWLAKVGGEDGVIAVAESTPSLKNIGHYAQIVQDAWQRRRIEAAARDLMAKARDSESSISEVIAKAQEVSATSAALMPRSVFAHISEIDVAQDNEIGVPTGWDLLDAQISTKGWPQGQLSIVRAYHKGGKTTCMVQSALCASSSGLKVLYATFADLHRRHIKRRMMRMLTGYQYPPDGGSLFDDWHKELDELNKRSIDVYDVSETDDGGTVEEFTAWAKSIIKIQGPWDVCFVDYAQELISSNRKVAGKMDEQMECARLMNRFAAQTKMPVVVGSQITKDLGGGIKTKWGRDWEEKAGWVLTIEDPQPGGDQDLTNIDITYSRFGAQGTRALKVPVRFNRTHLTLDEVKT